MEQFMKINTAVNGFVWGPVMLVLLVGTGIYLSIAVGFIQFTKIGYWWKNTIGKIFKKGEAGDGEITPLQAVSTALASTVGTGNIAGVTGAIILGGPGAVFWMWVSALFGMVTKFSEVTLAVKYRERNEKGDWCGGPMYYIKNGLGPKWKWLGGVFAVLGAIAAFGIGNIAQVHSIADSVKSVAVAFNENAASRETMICLITGICVAIFVALVLLGGVKRIGQVTEKLVPLMAVIYIVCALVVVFANISAVPGVFASIFKGAFNPAAVTGGAAGMSIKLAMTKGVGRGVFSNEAGLGSAPIAHAATSERNPVKQGLYGIFEVFMDTIVICTLTSLVVLCSGAADGNYGNAAAAGVPTAVAGFATVFGDKAGSLILAVGLLLFATSTILGWALYGTRCAEFLFGSKIIRPYQIIFCLVVVAGAVADLTLVWDISDTLNGLMSIPNLIALLLLSPVVIKVTKEHFAGLRKETALAVSFFFSFAARDGKKQKSGIISQVLLYNRKKLCYHNSARLSCAFPHLGRGGFTDPPLSVGRIYERWISHYDAQRPEDGYHRSQPHPRRRHRFSGGSGRYPHRAHRSAHRAPQAAPAGQPLPPRPVQDDR